MSVTYTEIRKKFKSLDIIGTGPGPSLFSSSIKQTQKLLARNDSAGDVSHIKKTKN